MKCLKPAIKAIFSFRVLLAVALSVPQIASAQFANGADIGWLSQMESSGYVFKNSAGIQENCMTILKEKGINALRFRVWVNPAAKWCGKKDVATMAHRADSMGFKVMLDFHCSDTWADPGHQAKPAAWAADSLPQLLQHLYNHVYGMLDTLKTIGVIPAWVQIGNETNDGMLWEDGRASTHMDNFAAMIKSGYSAVKAVDSSIQVIVHLSNGHDDAMFRRIFDGLKNNVASWDIIGMSVYPYWANLNWAVDDSLALITMNDMIARYQTKIMVVEAGYLASDPVNANHYLLDLIAKTKSAGGLGVFYWEPESYNWQGYQLGAWDPATKMPTAAMDAFLGIATPVQKESLHIPGESELMQNYPNPFNPSTSIHYKLARRTLVRLTVYNLIGQDVASLVNEVKDPGEYSTVWNGSGDGGRSLATGVYVVRMETNQTSRAKRIVFLK